MPNKPEIHYKLRCDTYGKHVLRQVYCGQYRFRPKTTTDPNGATCPKCRGMLAAAMFKNERRSNETRTY